MKFIKNLIKRMDKLSADGYIMLSNPERLISFSDVGNHLGFMPDLDKIDDEAKPEVVRRVLEDFNQSPLPDSVENICSAIWLETYQETYDVILPDYQSPFVK